MDRNEGPVIGRCRETSDFDIHGKRDSDAGLNRLSSESENNLNFVDRGGMHAVPRNIDPRAISMASSSRFEFSRVRSANCSVENRGSGATFPNVREVMCPGPRGKS